MNELITVPDICRELKTHGDSLRVWANHLGIQFIKLNNRNYCTQEDYLKLKDFYNQPNLKEIKLKLETEKRKKTCQIKYGGNSPMSSQKTKDKIKSTCLEKYGVDSAFKTKEVRNKIHKTLINRYGVDNIAYVPGVKEKKKKTCLEKYGVEYYTQTQEMKDKGIKTKTERYGDPNYNNREKCKLTCLEKYGQDNVTKVNGIKDKSIQTNLKKYGVEYYTQTQEMKDKSAKTSLERYGTRKPSQSKEVKEKMKETTFKHYGVEHPLQSNELLRKSHKKWQVVGLDNISFASKEEAYYYIYLKDNNYNFEYQVEYPIPYKDKEGSEHIFIVDFKVNDKYIEIKGDQFFDSNGNAQFVYNQNNVQDNIKRLSIWESKLEIIKNNDNIELILASTFNKGGKNFYMKEYFIKNYEFIKRF